MYLRVFLHPVKVQKAWLKTIMKIGRKKALPDGLVFLPVCWGNWS
jgi:hypothetical protein